MIFVAHEKCNIIFCQFIKAKEIAHINDLVLKRTSVSEQSKIGERKKKIFFVKSKKYHRNLFRWYIIFKNGTGQNHPLQPVLKALGHPVKTLAAGELGHRTAVPLLDIQIELLGTQPGQMPGNTADILSDGHLVVIEDNDHRFTADCGIIQTLIGHTAGAGTVANQG